MADLARQVESEFAGSFAEMDATFEVFPIRISHLRHVGSGAGLGITPHNPRDLNIVGDFELETEIWRRRRFSNDWIEIRRREEVLEWARAGAREYLERLRRLTAPGRGSGPGR